MQKMKKIARKTHQNLKKTWTNKLLAILMEGAAIASIFNEDGDVTVWLVMTFMALVVFFSKENLVKTES